MAGRTNESADLDEAERRMLPCCQESMLKLSLGQSAPRLAGTCVVLSAVALATSASAQEKSADSKWYDPLELDLGASMPITSSGEVLFAGDGAVGYQLENFGFAARGSGRYYSVDNQYANSDVWQHEESGEGWFLTGHPTDTARFEIRAAGGGAYLESDYTPRPASGIPTFFHDEDSWMGRGSLLVGAEFRGSAALTAYVLAGGGFQYESYGYLKADPRDPVGLYDTTSTSGTAEGRAQLRWSFVPNLLSARLRGNAMYFSYTRQALLTTVGTTTTATESLTKVKQLELHGRLSVEVDALAFAGIVPFVAGGIDHITNKNESVRSTFTAPFVGAGLFKPVGD